MSLFSIIVPSYNRPDFLCRLLNSIRQQSFRDFEVVVVDDASPDTDAYECVVKRFSSQLQFKYLRNPENRGAQYSRNRGVRESTGDYIAFVDDDDEWLPHKLDCQANLFASDSGKLGLVYSWADAVSAEGSIIHQYRAEHEGNVLGPLLEACFIPSPTVIVSRAALEVAGGFDESFPSCQDWDMWTRVVEAGYDIAVVKEVLAIHHKHGRESIGTSPKSLMGYLLFYTKHTALYDQLGMNKDLSEKYRWLAYQANQLGDRSLTEQALRCAVSTWKGNVKAWIRYFQFQIRGQG